MQNIPHGITEFLSEINLSQREPNARYEICKSFRDRLEVPHQHIIVWNVWLSRLQVISLFENRDRQSTLAISKCLQRLKFSNDIFFLSFKFSFTEFSVFQFFSVLSK